MKNRMLRPATGTMFGTLSFVALIPFVVFASLFAIDSNLTYCYEKKIDFMLEQTIRLLADSPSEASNQQAQHLLQELAKSNGLPCSDLKAQLSTAPSATGECLTLTARGSLRLISNSYLPTWIKFARSKSIDKSTNTRFAHLSFDAYPLAQLYPERSPSAYVPVIRPKSKMPIWTFAPDDTIQSLYLNSGSSPAIPTDTANDYFSHMESLY